MLSCGGSEPELRNILALDIHDIKVVLAGYEPWSRRIKVQPGKGIEATLVPMVH